MRRIAIVIAGSALAAGCGSFSPGDYLPSFGGAGYPLKLESDPPGAEARTSLGQSCRTPCTVAVPASGDFAVTFALAGYESQTVPVSIVQSSGQGSDYSTAVQLNPNPVEVQLEPAAPAPVAKKKPKPKAKTGGNAAATESAAAKPPAQPAAAPPDDAVSAQRAAPPAPPQPR
jgi:hypothetical protein